MLLTGAQLIDMPIMSLQTGKELARTAVAVINPHNLCVIAYRITGPHLDDDPSYLRVADIREMGSLGLIIDSSDEFVIPDDIITQKDIYELGYELEGKQVMTTRKKKLGKVSDYVIDIDSFTIEQLVVKRPLLQSFNDNELLIHRGQIVEVNDSAIVVKSGDKKSKAKITVPNAPYVNPFRQTSPQTGPAHSQTQD
jgi:sporulation protein YlmC with PRC-barrel domain